mmetsp:Transcript_13346/g.19641  ORF Transcript_13346/g.19641 Transcript_13346/m.19641 type:complete len:1500 (+) Transcript_13346:116-4615(+)
MNSNNNLRSRSQEEGEIGEEEGEISSVPRRPSSFRLRSAFTDRPPGRGFRRNSSGGGGRGGRGGIAGVGRGGGNSNWMTRRGGRGGRGNSFNRSESSNFSRSEGAPFNRNASGSIASSGDFSSQSIPSSSGGGNRPTDPRSSNTNIPLNPSMGDPRRDLESRTPPFRSNNSSYRRNSNFSRSNNFPNNVGSSSASSGSDSGGIFRTSNNNNSASSNFARSFSTGNEESGGDFARSSSRSENDFRASEFRNSFNRQSDGNFRSSNSSRSDVEFRGSDFQNTPSRNADDFRPASSSSQETDSFGRISFQPNQPSQQQRRLSSYSSLADTRSSADYNSSSGHGGFRQSPTQRRKTFQFQQTSSNNNSSKSMQDATLPFRNNVDVGSSSLDNSRLLPEAGEVRNNIQETGRRPSDTRGNENQRQLPQRTPPQRWDPRFPRPQVQTQQLSQSNQASSLQNNDISEEEEQTRESPLTVSVLGEANVEKAIATIKKIGEIMNEASLISNVTEETRLPGKKLMDSAMQKQDSFIKKAKKDFEQAECELSKIREEEEEKLQLQKKAALEERKRQEEEEKRCEEERLEKERAEKEKEMQLNLEECRSAWEEKIIEFDKNVEVEKQKILSDLQRKIEEERNAQRERCDSKVATQREAALDSFVQSINKIKRQIHKSTKEVNQANAGVAQLESELNSTMKIISNHGIRHSLHDKSTVNAILADNRRKAEISRQDSLYFIPDQETSNFNLVRGKTIDEWSKMTRRVTGRADALYTEPGENPFFEKNQSVHQQIAPLVKEYIRDNNRKLNQRQAELAEEYVVRKQLYDKKLRRRGSKRESVSGNSKRGKGRASILGMNNQAVSSPPPEGPSTPGGGRTSGRRARRGGSSTPGDVVRSEYEQEQIIAELTAKEALEKRIAHGGIRPTRQICKVEKRLTATFVNTFESHRTLDPVKESQEQSRSNIWTDMEKCIFLDRFLQHPKDFRKIASFLRNKSTKDCVAFYYHSKQSVPYKVALKEHLMRRKRRGDYQNWDATIEASLSCGAVVSAGTSEEKPVIFKLPAEDTTFNTFDLHPIASRILDRVDASGDHYNKKDIEEHQTNKRRKRKRDPLFVLEKKARKYLKSSIYDAQPKVGKEEIKSTMSRDKFEVADQSTVKKASNKWTASEKKIFHEIIREHGTNWSMLEEALHSKNPSQIKSFYNDQKKQLGKKHSGVAESKATRIESEIPRKKQAIVEIERKGSSVPMVAEEQPEKSRRQTQKAHPEQTQQEARLLQQKTGSASDFHQKAYLELAAHKAAQEQAKMQTEQQNSKHEAVLLMHQQQNHLLKHQAAQEEARRLLQSQLGLSGLAPWATQLAALQHQQQPQHQHQHQHSSSQQNEAVRDYAQSFQNAMALRQGASAHHGFSLDPSIHRSIGLSRLQGLNRGIGNASLLQHAESSNQRHEVERALAGLRGSDAANAETLNAIRAAAGLSRAAAPASIAGALALLSHAVNHGDGRFSQDQHHPEHPNRDGY